MSQNSRFWRFWKIFWRTTSRHLLEARVGWRGRGRGGGGSSPEAEVGEVGGGRVEEQADQVWRGERELVEDVDDRDSSVGLTVKDWDSVEDLTVKEY